MSATSTWAEEASLASISSGVMHGAYASRIRSGVHTPPHPLLLSINEIRVPTLPSRVALAIFFLRTMDRCGVPVPQPVGAEVLGAQPHLASIVGTEHERTPGEVDRFHRGPLGRDEAAVWIRGKGDDPVAGAVVGTTRAHKLGRR